MCKANENYFRALAKALGPVPRHCISPSFFLAYAWKGQGTYHTGGCLECDIVSSVYI